MCKETSLPPQTLTPCIVCEKVLNYVCNSALGEVADGVEFYLYGGFGSTFDWSCVLAHICDECLEKKIEKGHAMFLYDELEIAEAQDNNDQ